MFREVFIFISKIKCETNFRINSTGNGVTKCTKCNFQNGNVSPRAFLADKDLDGIEQRAIYHFVTGRRKIFAWSLSFIRKFCLLLFLFMFSEEIPQAHKATQVFPYFEKEKVIFSAATASCRENPLKWVKSIQSSACSNMLKIMNQPLQLMQFSAQISNFAFCKPLPHAGFKPFMCKPPSFKSSVLRQSQGQSMPYAMYVLTYTTGLNWHPDKNTNLIHLVMSLLHLFYSKLLDFVGTKTSFSSVLVYFQSI